MGKGLRTAVIESLILSRESTASRGQLSAEMREGSGVGSEVPNEEERGTEGATVPAPTDSRCRDTHDTVAPSIKADFNDRDNVGRNGAADRFDSLRVPSWTNACEMAIRFISSSKSPTAEIGPMKC